MKLVRFIVLLSFLFGLKVSFGQTKTPYLTRVEVLTKNFLKHMGISEEALKKGNQMTELEAMFQLTPIMLNIQTEKGLLIYVKYLADIEDAEKLKTEVDFKREREAAKNQELVRKKRLHEE